MKKVSCIIPTYNEEEQIGIILKTLNPLLGKILDEVIVIDDFSSDRTKEIVRNNKNITLVEHIKNEGKSKTISDGIKKAKNDIILMIDGDLMGLNETNIKNLINPVLTDLVDMSISYRGNTPKWWIHFFKIETFSGERCFYKKLLLDNLKEIEYLPGYGLEVYINEKLVRNKLRIKSVPMKNVTIKFKWHKHGLIVGVWKELLMWKNIFATVNPVKLVVQIIKMKKLLVK